MGAALLLLVKGGLRRGRVYAARVLHKVEVSQERHGKRKSEVKRMSLHPISIAIVLLLFGLMAIPPLLAFIKERRKGLATLMLIVIVGFFFAAYVAAQVPPGSA
jgi:hypothetical protein